MWALLQTSYDSDSDLSDAATVVINWENDALSEASTVVIGKIADQDLSGFLIV